MCIGLFFLEIWFWCDHRVAYFPFYEVLVGVGGAQQPVGHSRRHIGEGSVFNRHIFWIVCRFPQEAEVAGDECGGRGQILGLQPWMNCVILVTCNRLRWKSCDRMSSVSCTRRLPSIRSLWNTATAASERPMNRRQDDTSSSDSTDKSAGGRQLWSWGGDKLSTTVADVPPPSAPREKSVVGLVVGSGEGQGDWRLNGFRAPKGAKRLWGGGGLRRGAEEVKESAHGSAQVACAGWELVELSVGMFAAGSGLAGLGAGQSVQEQG